MVGAMDMQYIHYEKIYNEMFSPVLKVRDIRLARIMTRKEKAQLPPGSADVILKSYFGDIITLDRNTFIDRYRHLNGDMINLSGWKSIHTYLVIAPDNARAYAMYIPSKYGLKVKSRYKLRVHRGSYIICPTNPDGSINRYQFYVLASDVYRKMFTPPTNKLAHLRDILNNKTAAINKSRNIRANTRKEYIATGRLMRQGKLVGFVVQHKSGETININKNRLMELCREKKIQNICLKVQDGKEVIRGVGIRISDLPIVEI